MSMSRINDKHYLEELQNVVDNYPVYPGNTISVVTIRKCEAKGWVVRDKQGFWIPTAKGILVDRKRNRDG